MPKGVYVRTPEYYKALHAGIAKRDQSGEKGSFYGKKHSEATKEKIRQARIGKPGPWKGKTIPPEVREQISKTLTGRKEPDHVRIKKSESHIGYKQPSEVREKISKANSGLKRSPDVCRKLSDMHRGNKSIWWKGGVSFEPYCPKFNNDFKERVREFFGRKCAACGIDEVTLKRKLDVHHVNFNKMTCCDNTIPLFVPLCHSCHGKTQKDRQYWEDWFTTLINEQYGGKCYLPKEELQLPETSQTGDKSPA